MKQKTLEVLLKIIICCVGVGGLVVYFVFLPNFGGLIAKSYPELDYMYWPWLSFLWATGVPCYIGLVYCWRVASNIGKDRSFSEENAHYLARIAWLAGGDGLFFFLGNVVLFLLGMNHPGVALASLVVDFIAVAITVVAAGLSHLVLKAAKLQNQSDLTI